MKSKKKIVWYIISIVIFCLVVGIVYSKFFKIEATELAHKSVSEVRQNFFVGSDELSNVNLSSGYREEPYAIDGVHNEVVPFGVLVLRTSLSNIESPTFKLKIDEEELSGVMERNPYDNTFVADIEKIVDDACVVNLEILIEDDCYNFALVNVSNEWEINHYEALDIGINEMKEFVQTLKHGNNFKGECYVKVVSDPNNLIDVFYWYVAIVSIGGDSHAVVIDSNTGEILSKN